MVIATAVGWGNAASIVVSIYFVLLWLCAAHTTRRLGVYFRGYRSLEVSRRRPIVS
jgi:hypothetical protein